LTRKGRSQGRGEESARNKRGNRKKALGMQVSKEEEGSVKSVEREILRKGIAARGPVDLSSPKKRGEK